MSDRPPSAQRQTLEAALVADPDDLAAHMAYADLLAEEGDPRGELIRVQIALETTPEGPDRDRLTDRETELILDTLPALLGELAEPFAERIDVSYRFRRGWLDEVEVGTMREDLAAALAAAPETRLLRRLAVVNPDAAEFDPAGAYELQVLAGASWFEEDEERALVPLLDSPYLGNVRVFHLGDADHERCDVGDGPVAGLLEKMPRLEDLRLFLWRLEDAERIFAMPFPRLKTLHVGGVFSYPLQVLAENASLGALEELVLQSASPNGHRKLWPDEACELIRSPHLKGLKRLGLPFLAGGDMMCEELANPGVLGRFEVLDLKYGEITDAGADLLANSPDVARLAALDLTGNHLTAAGVARLRAIGVGVACDGQTEPEPVRDPADDPPLPAGFGDYGDLGPEPDHDADDEGGDEPAE